MKAGKSQSVLCRLTLFGVALAVCGNPGAAQTVRPAQPDFGPNVIILDPSMSKAQIQKPCDEIFALQEKAQFGSDRKAILFKPGHYEVDVRVGFYTHVQGLGASPDDVEIHGAVRSNPFLPNMNSTCNFWRGCENLAVKPGAKFDGISRWAVAQATPFRRMHIKGDLALDEIGWSSGGFIADSRVDGTVDSGSQQQWFTRNSEIKEWKGHSWNTVFVGVQNAPKEVWPQPPYTVVDQAPIVREKPFLMIDAKGAYQVFVPALRARTRGVSWAKGSAEGQALPIEAFHIARPDQDTAATLNAAMKAGKHLLLTPGIYHLNETLQVTRPGTVVLGLGFATLMPENGLAAMRVADVDGVKIAGLLFDANLVNAPTLMEVGPKGSAAHHVADPTSLHDVFFRVGGVVAGKADTSLIINSHDVIGDHFWVWRADHGAEARKGDRGASVGWDKNTTRNGLVVNGDDVTVYGLFVEHYHEYQTLWNGERGRVYFYQSEIPYDVPDQASWMSGKDRTINGFASYKVADGVKTHEAWGLGVYCFFWRNPSLKLHSAIEAPSAPGVKFRHMVTVSLGGGTGEITHVLNNEGRSVNKSLMGASLEMGPK